MKILFLGTMFSPHSLEEAYKASKCGVQMAPHLFQDRLIQGLKADENTSVTVFNVPPVGSFPMNYKKLYIHGHKWEENEQIGYLNIPVLKWKIQRRKLLRKVGKWIEAQPANEKCCILAYCLYEPFLDVLVHMKKKYPYVHTALIQTDCVPGRNDMEQYMTAEAKRRGDRAVEKAKTIDSFVLLSQPLTEVLEVGDRSYVITECICDPKQPMSKQKAKSENIFLYSGTTEKVYGICDVVDAIKELPQAQLWICGAGNSDDYIRETAKTYPNIRHFGYLSQTELADLRDKCDFLINPRRPTGTYTKYSFPSKTAEYMLSGKPAVMYKLEGIPDEYDDYLHYLTAEDAEGIRSQLQAVMSADYEKLLQKAEEARAFMLENKNAAAQAKKILTMLER